MYMNKITMEAVREKFPSPSKSQTKATDYCVGGALMRYIGDSLNGACFPNAGMIGKYLMRANPMLPEVNANNYGATIIDYNDLCMFEDAWTTLGKALSY